MNKKITSRSVKIAIVSRDNEIYSRLYDQKLPSGTQLIHCSKEPSTEVFKDAEVILSEPDVAASFVDNCKSLKWLQSTWAGNNKLQFCNARNYQLTGVKGIFYDQMKEYVFAIILSHFRELDNFRQLQESRKWRSIPGRRVRGLTLGILGFGDIAKELAGAAQVFGLKIIGLTRNGGVIEESQCYSSQQKLAFASACDVVVNLLPETEKTKGLCDKDFFANMRSNSLFINVGRGSVIDASSSLIQALDNEEIGAAVLDVFEEEPLPPTHPFYHHPKIKVTNHSAAISDPLDVFNVFLENLHRYINQQPMLYVHDFGKGY